MVGLLFTFSLYGLITFHYLHGDIPKHHLLVLLIISSLVADHVIGLFFSSGMVVQISVSKSEHVLGLNVIH